MTTAYGFFRCLGPILGSRGARGTESIDGRPRGGRRRPAEQRYELAPPHHSITSSARASSAGGTFDSERPGCLQVDEKLEFGRLQHWQVGGLRALEDLTAHYAGLTKPTRNIGPVAHHPPSENQRCPIAT